MLDGMTGWQKDYAGSLDASVVKGMRVGVLDFARNDSPRLNAQFDAAIARMEAAGATIVRIENNDTPPEFWGQRVWCWAQNLKYFLMNT